VNPLPEQARELSRALAAELLRRDAIKINLQTPFLLTSGNYSPIYINCRQLISWRSAVKMITAAASLQLELRSCAVDAIAGGETAGIPFAAFLADALDKPMIYVRKAVKGHGTASRVEGMLDRGSRVLLFEDLITDGLSKVSFIKAIREDAGIVEETFVILDRQQGGSALLAQHGVRLTALTDIELVLGVASDWGLLESSAIDSVRVYLASPSEWHAKRSLPYSPLEAT
jgi:orotate phosphoribosyltransferase